jgi:hypothetical protein
MKLQLEALEWVLLLYETTLADGSTSDRASRALLMAVSAKGECQSEEIRANAGGTMSVSRLLHLVVMDAYLPYLA